MDVKQLHKDIQEKDNANLALKIGDRVQHILSGIVGCVVEVAWQGSRQLVSIQTTKGKKLAMLDRQEFRLNTFGICNTPVSENKPVEVSKPLKGIEGDGYANYSLLHEIVK